MRFFQFARNPCIEFLNIAKLFQVIFNACMRYMKLLCNLTCCTVTI
ncbi:hypothetical protein X975_20059, partial [Stegodyphus mimosarum]